MASWPIFQCHQKASWFHLLTKSGHLKSKQDQKGYHQTGWKDGGPIQPDFDLSGRIKAAEDLIAWSYHGDGDDVW